MPACWRGWAGSGPCAWPIEGTGSYGAGLARHIAAAGVRVAEVDRSDRQDRRRAGKSDPLDAVSAARAAQSGRAAGAPKGRDGAVEAIRALMVAKRSARAGRTQTINQARALIVTGPDDLRARFARHTPADLVAELASLRPRPGATVGYATAIALRELGRRARFGDGQLERLDEFLIPLVTARAPALLALYGAGPPALRPCCWSQLATIPNGCVRRPPGHTCAPPPPSQHPQGRSPATASTPAATARPTTPSTGS
jgi:transposase